MFRKSLLTILVAGAASIALPAYAQTEEAGRQEVAVQALGSFVTSTTQNGIDNKATNSSGVLATYRYFFSKHHGVEANYGYTLNTQKYVSGEGLLGVNTNSHEVSGAYIFRMPLRNMTPFALAGAGALVFDPRTSWAPTPGPAPHSSMVPAPISISRTTSSCVRNIAALFISHRRTICRR